MKCARFSSHRGFTLVELLVVVTVIAVLILAVMSAILGARKESRDYARINHAEQLKLGIRLYKEALGTYPNYPSGARLIPGSVLATPLAPFVTVQSDPLGAVSAATYAYWYDSSFTCTEAGQRVVLVQRLENTDNSNLLTLCGATAGSQLLAGWDPTLVHVTIIQ